MKKQNLALLTTSLIILASSCGKSINKAETNPVLESKTQELSVNTDSQVVVTDANIVYRVDRRTALKFDQNDQIINRNQFTEDLNMRVLTVTSEKAPLKNGIVKCRDLTNPTDSTPFEKPLESDFTKAQFEITLHPQVNRFTKIECHIQVDEQLIDKSSVVLDLVPDLYVEGLKNYNEVMLLANSANKVSAMVLEEGSTLLTEGTSLNIEADTFISFQDAEIKTFLNETRTALHGKDGLSGGSIQINANFMTGALKISMLGQNGGLVRTVEDMLGFPEEFSQANLDGVHEQGGMVTDCGDMKRERPEIDHCRQRTHYVMRVAPTSGKPGLKGIDGKNGLNGKNGGDSGTYTITTKNALQFNLDSVSEPGLASAPTKGGKGGPGTPGGRIFCRDNSWCAAHGITVGRRGDDGQVGKDGLPALDGRKLTSEFRILKD